MQLLLHRDAAPQFGVVSAEDLLRELEHPREVLLGDAEQRHDDVQRVIHRNIGDEVALGTDVAHLVDGDLGQLVDVDLQVAHGFWPEPVGADGPHVPVVRVVHVDQRAQAHAGVELGARLVVGLRGLQQRSRLADPQVVRPLDVHDVGVLGDRPERTVRRHVDVRDGRVGAKVGQGGVESFLVGVGGGVREHLGGVVDDWRAHSLLLVECCHYESCIDGSAGNPGCDDESVGFGHVRSGRRRGWVTALFAAVLAVASCGPGATVAADRTLVQTASGAVRGALGDDHLLFAGIPYAAPPVGALRWRPPQPVQPWQGVRDASKYGPRCVQDKAHDPDFGRSVSEDCLTLNVWTPKSRAADALPVMVWIHGGGFVNGSGDIYDARWLVARGGIIVVTLNYRLGALGFLAHPALAADGDVGNYGLADQQAALRWVHDNIAGFGGDPGKVTIAGESAGAMSVCDHLVAPGSAGLFRAAVIQSGPCQAQADRTTAERASVDYAASVGCTDVQTAAACLRAVPSDKLEAPPVYYRLGDDGLTGPISGTPSCPSTR